ncbi:MAG: phosphonate ABC transporter, permease protein PhnE [Paracoccaceae bacterium]
MSETAAPAVTADDLAARMRLRVGLAVGSLVLILAYLAYAWIAFDVGGLLAKSRPERAVLLGTDSVMHKIHVTKDLRRGGLEIAVEGERTATFDRPPDWVAVEDEDATIDLGDGYTVEIVGDTVSFTVPGYGVITARREGREILQDLPEGPVPEWISGNSRKFDARPTLGRRVQMSITKIEVHRYFWGWENFWFPFRSPLADKSFSEIVGLAWSDERIDPEMSNAAYIFDTWWSHPDWQHGVVMVALFETILMAVLGTLTAVLLGLPLAFLAASNFTPNMVVRFVVRRFLDFVRAIDNLIWALIFTRAFGLGPLTGALAIGITDTGTLGKLFSEALENIDDKQVEGVRATGASQLQRYRYGVIPQLLPVFISQTLYYLESNTRSATVIGALGAGGIGLVLVQTLQTYRDWENTLYIISLTIVVVVMMDQLSAWLRRRLIQGT